MPSRIKASVIGDRELLRAISQIDERMIDKIAPSGMRGYLRVVAKGIKSEIPAKIKEARRGINSRFVKRDKRTKQVVAKVGVNVGKNRTKQKAEAEKVKQKRKKRPGVGISAANLHWVIKGTEKRTRKKDGASTGRMPDLYPNIVIDGAKKSRGAALAKFRELSAAALKREAVKTRKQTRSMIMRKLAGL